MKTASQKIAWTEKVGYGLGDCAANFVFQTQLVFLSSFYVDVFGISAVAVGWIFLGSRLFDAFNDPLMGALADRTETRWGKYRPWLLWTAPFFAGAFVLAYTTPDFGTTGKVVWALITYNLLMIAYTANNIPYSALTGVITSDPDERTSLVSWRFLMAMTAALLVQAFTPDLVDWFGSTGSSVGTEATVDQAQGYQYTMAMWAAIAVVLFVITFLSTKERVQPSVRQETSMLRDLADLLGNRTWLALATCTVFVFVYLAMRGSVTPFYFDYYVAQQQPIGFGAVKLQPMGWFNGLGLSANLLGILLSGLLAKRFGKRDVFAVSIGLTGLLTIAFYWLEADQLAAIIGLQALLQFVYGVSIPLLWAMMADVADFTEWRTRRRATAMTFAATVFALKLGLSFGGALQNWILYGYGYVPNTQQTPDALEGIRRLMSVYPAAAFVIAAVALVFYEINRPLEKQIYEDLEQRRSRRHDSNPTP